MPKAWNSRGGQSKYMGRQIRGGGRFLGFFEDRRGGAYKSYAVWSVLAGNACEKMPGSS